MNKSTTPSLWSGSIVILLTIVLTLILSLVFSSFGASDKPEYAAKKSDNEDILLYVSDEGRLITYNPSDRTETMLFDQVSSFVPARDGRIAFNRPGENDIYLFDPSLSDPAPMNISPKSGYNNYPLAWSLDGHYLAFVSYQDSDDRFLYVWDGETTTSIMPEHGLDKADTFYASWSNDGRLAFTTHYGWSSLDIPPELYLWDGDKTINLSQNPSGYDSAASWSKTGKLLFYSTREDGQGVYVWDGISFKDTFPDIEPAILFDTGAEPNSVSWTDNGFVAYDAYLPRVAAVTKVIILWDPEQAAIVREIPVSSTNAWSRLSADEQMILSSHLASGTPSYYLDIENTRGEILFSTHTGEFSWSPRGYLAYCRRDDDRNWILSIWDGKETWDVASVSYRPAQWLHERKVFSCNSG